MPRKPKPIARASMSFTSLSVEINGSKASGGSFSYERVEHADGTVTEHRSSDAIPPNATIGDVISAALQQLSAPPRRRVKSIERKP